MTEDEIIEQSGDDALVVVEAFIRHHRAAAIPALIGACVVWAVNNGAEDLVVASLESAKGLAADAKAILARTVQ